MKGKYLSVSEMEKAAEEFKIPTAKRYEGYKKGEKGGEESKKVEELIEKVGKEKGLEGCVLKFDNGEWYKIKSEWYFSQSKSHLALPTSERDLWLSILSNKIDDVRTQLTVEVKKKKIFYTFFLFNFYFIYFFLYNFFIFFYFLFIY